MAGASKTDLRLEAEAGLQLREDEGESTSPPPSSSMSTEASEVRSATLREVAGMKSSEVPPPKPAMLVDVLRVVL